MGQKADIMQLAYNLARNSIVDTGPFNSQIAKDSLLIFINACPNRQHVSAAVAVLNALDELNAITADDRRSRIWKERKLAVRVAFEDLRRVFDDDIAIADKSYALRSTYGA